MHSYQPRRRGPKLPGVIGRTRDSLPGLKVPRGRRKGTKSKVKSASSEEEKKRPDHRVQSMARMKPARPLKRKREDPEFGTPQEGFGFTTPMSLGRAQVNWRKKIVEDVVDAVGH